jgi:hypothetical protein
MEKEGEKKRGQASQKLKHPQSEHFIFLNASQYNTTTSILALQKTLKKFPPNY